MSTTTDWDGVAINRQFTYEYSTAIWFRGSTVRRDGDKGVLVVFVAPGAHPESLRELGVPSGEYRGWRIEHVEGSGVVAL